MLVKKAAMIVIAVALAATLSIVFANLILSNTLTASWTVQESGSNLVLWWDSNTPGGTLNRGVWYQTGIGLQNVGVATYKITLIFRIYTDISLTTTDVKTQYWDGLAWQDLPLTVQTVGGRDILVGTFGPGGGFDVGPGYNVVTQFRYYFEGSAPVGHGYSFDTWAEQV
jgi:hypothetical protein